MADKLFARIFRHKRQNEKKEAIDHSLHLDDLNTSEEPKTPVYVEDDNFVDRNEEFINLDDDLGDVEDENDENEVENEVENDSDNVEGEEEDEDDNVEDANLYENFDGGSSIFESNFSKCDEAGHFFRAYALRNGFAIKIQAIHRNKDNEIYGRLYICRLYGKSVIAESSQNKRRREVLPKSECKVRMYVNYQKKKCHWEVTSLDLVHNHGLVSPCKMNLVQRERHVNTVTRSLIKTLYGSGVLNCQVMNVIGNIHGGNDKVGFNVQHVKNVLRDERKKRFKISDVQAGLDLLHRLNEESGSKYFIRTEVDEENRLKCLVWIDPRCIMAYQNFGDVMAFDTTYRTNRYAMPFVPFTGVNHHYQSVIFGFALMRDEHASTFEWILRTWLEGVGNNPPLTIITDQDQAMASAIAVVHLNTTHLLCS
ncbi:protein FAR1-RELATED SEQUENCE 5-like [Apium graveolens]|uniref:protein FAR1-RELATED SEQUENCE 5-like n=1 Tax=Apium graveolens TaxID=4045 RepID=UPI003D78BFAB